MAQEGTNAANEEDPASSKETVPSTLDQADANQRELGKVWSAFWLTLTITMLLAVAVMEILIFKKYNGNFKDEKKQ
jgi:nucleoside recognition membrane protein YjiH